MVSTVSNMIFQEYILYCVPSFKTERVNGTISIERILSVNIPSEHSHKRKVFNPSLGELTGCVGQVDEFRHICAQFMNKNLSEGASMKQATNESKEIAGHMPPAISEFLDELNQEFQSKKDNVENKLKHAKEQNNRDDQKKLEELMNVPTIKMAYNALEIANNKLIATAEKMEQISKNLQYSQHKLNIFLKNTQDELEMNKLKTEYNKVARECLVQLTKFRLSVQGWSSQHPQYAKVADWILTGAKGGAILVAGIGIVSTIYVSVPISIPATLAGAGVISAKQMVTKFLKEKVITYAKRQGITLKEKSDFVDTAEWLISGIEHFASIKEVVKVATNPTKLIKQNFIKTYTSFDKYGDIALALRRATEVYTRTQKERLVSDVLRVFANE